MRFLKDKGLAANADGNVIMDATGGLLLPKGTTAERPTIEEGAIRFNTETNAVEAYINSTWEIVKVPAATAIQKQTLGPSDGTETVFGPLLKEPDSDNNILVLVENLLQVSETNYDVVYSDGVDGSLGPNGPYAAGWYLKFTGPVPAVGPGGQDIHITVFYGFV